MKKTTDLTEGINLYYTEARVFANTDVKANTAYRNTGHLPLAGGTLTGDLSMGNYKIISLATPTADTDGANKKYIDDKFELYEEGKVLAERYSIATYANNTAEMDARFNGLTPNASQYLTNLYTMGWSGDQFGVIYNCYLYVPTDGNITFRVRSDDSSDWFIDDALVASNYGGHAVGGAPLATSTVFMTAGFHKSFSRVIEQTGGEGMIHDWDLNGGSTFTTIPTANIFIPGVNNLFDTANITSGTIITTSERANIATNNNKVSYPSADSTKVGFISVTQAVNLDTMESDIATNNNKVSYPSADSTKVGFISVTQAVNLDTMESDIATNNNKVSYPSADSTKVGFISVTQAVNLDTMESDIATNNNKVSYPSADSTKVGFISVTQAVNLDTMESDIATNNNKVSYPSADSTKVGFISVTQAVNLDTMESDITTNNAYRNVGHLPLSGGTMTGDITMGGQVPTTYNGPIMTSPTSPAPYVITASSSLSTGSQYYAFDGRDNFAWYSTPSNRYDSSGNVIGTPYPQLIGGTNYYGEWIQADLGANYIISEYGTNPLYNDGGVPKSWAIGVSTDGTSFAWLDRKVDETYTTYTTFTPATPMIGRYILMSIDKVNGSLGRAIISVLSYKYETLNYSIYNLKEPTASHYAATKGYVDSSVQTLNTAIGGKLSLTGGTMTGNLDMGGFNINKVGTVDGYNLDTLNTNINSKLPLSGGTMTGNLNMGNQDIDNVNQVFINRSSTANNKLVLYDGGSGSTTAFYGLGIQSATLLYNVDGSSANHKFYYSGTNELFRIGNAGVYSYRNLDVTGNITVSGTVDGIDIQSLNTTVGGKLSLAGGGVITNGSINIYTQARSGSHGTVKGLYVTSDFGQYSSGAEFRHSNGTQGTGIGYAGIYACGSNTNQDLTISTKGTGVLNLVENGVKYAVLRRRPNYNNEGQLSIRRQGYSGAGEVGYNGNLVAWASSNTAGDHTTGYAYMSTGASTWSAASDRRLKCDILDLKTDDCCTKICLLKPRNYHWKTDETKKMNTGFIADEVKQVYPEVVSNSNVKIGDDENIEGIDYIGMIPILVGAIQSMMCKINELKNRIEILESPII